MLIAKAMKPGQARYQGEGRKVHESSAGAPGSGARLTQIRAIPLKRVGDPDEIAGLVAYLASGESGYMTGSSLTIDGGLAL